MEKVEKDYTCVATRDLAQLFEEYKGSAPLSAIAARIPPNGMDVRDLKKYVVLQTPPFAGLRVADRIMCALGQSISVLAEREEIIVVPVPKNGAAKRMAEDEFWAQDVTPTHEALLERTTELEELRDLVL